MRELPIGIVGAGTAGLAAAAAMARAGRPVTLLERFDAPRPVGAGLLLQPTGLACLDRLGLAEAAAARGARIVGIDGRSGSGRAVLEIGYDRLDPRLHGVGIHRATLFELLLGEVQRLGVAIVTGAEVRSVEPAAAGVTVGDASGRVHGPFGLLVDASGMRSPLRRLLPGRITATPFRFGALWGVVPVPREWPDGERLVQRYKGAAVMAGLLPIGTRPERAGRLAALFWSLRRDRYPAWQEAGLDAWKGQLTRLWPEIAPLLHAITSPADLSLATYDDVTLATTVAPAWRLAVIGDAAHSTSPQLGQGANLALLDAVALADALDGASDVADALASYQRSRRRHVAFYQWASRLLTPFFQSESRLAGSLRDLSLGPLGRIPIVQRQMVLTLAGLKLGPLSAMDVQRNCWRAPPAGHNPLQVQPTVRAEHEAMGKQAQPRAALIRPVKD